MAAKTYKLSGGRYSGMRKKLNTPETVPWPEIFMWVAIIIVALSGTIILWNLMTMPAHAESGKCYSACTNPDRVQYDGWGNEFDAYGKLLTAAPCTSDPITGQPNPVSCTVQPDSRTVQIDTDFGGK